MSIEHSEPRPADERVAGVLAAASRGLLFSEVAAATGLDIVEASEAVLNLERLGRARPACGRWTAAPATTPPAS